MSNLKQALRLVAKRPGFAAVAVVTLALGIGANASIFSVVNAVLLRPLPFADASRLVFVASTDTNSGNELSVSYPDFLDWREASAGVGQLAAFARETVTLSGAPAAEQVAAELISANYLEILGITPVLGRGLQPDDDVMGGGSPVVLLGYELWQRHLGGVQDVLDRPVRVNGLEYAVIGVVPSGFRGLTDQADVWLPMTMFDAVNPSLRQYAILESRSTRWHSVVGRLRAGVSASGAALELATIAERLEQVYPNSNVNKSVRVRSARDALVGEYRRSLLVLLAAVGAVLLVACANLANLFLASGVMRRRELAVRLALGASRAQLIRQLLVESLVLALCGGVGGLLVAAWTIPLLMSAAPVRLPSFVTPALDGGVLAFVLAVSVVSSVMFGLVPALRCASVDPLSSLRNDERAGTTRTGDRRWQSAFVVAEIAVVFVLLIGAGLMLASFQRIRYFDPGFPRDRLLTFRLAVPGSSYPGDERPILIRELTGALEAVPGVEAVGMTSHIYFCEGYLTTRVVAEGQPRAPGDEGTRVYRQFVSEGYFAALGLPVRQGRAFSVCDVADAPRVAIVSESLARRFWPGGVALGRRFRFVAEGAHQPWTEVVGIVPDVRPAVRPETEQVDAQIYTPMLQTATGGSPGILVRTTDSPLARVGALRGAIEAVDSEIPMHRVATLDQLLNSRTASDRFSAWLMGLLGVLALLLAAVGISGVMTQAVVRQVREIGIRMALGAEPRVIVRRVVTHGLVLTMMGLVIGCMVALALTRLLESLLYGVSATDPAVFVLVALVLSATSLGACYLPARGAARIDPMIALRAE